MIATSIVDALSQGRISELLPEYKVRLTSGWVFLKRAMMEGKRRAHGPRQAAIDSDPSSCAAVILFNSSTCDKIAATFFKNSSPASVSSIPPPFFFEQRDTK